MNTDNCSAIQFAQVAGQSVRWPQHADVNQIGVPESQRAVSWSLFIPIWSLHFRAWLARIMCQSTGSRSLLLLLLLCWRTGCKLESRTGSGRPDLTSCLCWPSNLCGTSVLSSVSLSALCPAPLTKWRRANWWKAITIKEEIWSISGAE